MYRGYLQAIPTTERCFAWAVVVQRIWAVAAVVVAFVVVVAGISWP